MADRAGNGRPRNGRGSPGLWERLWPAATGVFRDREGPDERCLEGKRVPHSPTCDPDCDAVALGELQVGERGTISCLDDPGGIHARKLAAMGILPGTAVELTQRSPVFVLRIGYSDFALDRDLAQRVRVRREGARGEP